MSGGLLYVYGVVDGLPAELGEGIDGAPLRSVAVGRVAAVASEHASAPESSEDHLWQHEAVLERLLERGPVLPMRFGASVAGDRELEELLRAREDEFVELLAGVRGAVELCVRAELPAADPPPDPDGGTATARPSGTEYMRGRGRALREAEGARERLHGRLSDLSRRSTVLGARAVRGRDGVFRGAYLVDVERVDAFARCAEGLASEFGGELSCTGPWPPYSFVAGADR